MKESRTVRNVLIVMLLIVSVSIFLFTGISSASEWAKTYGGTSTDYASSVQLTSDGGYVVAGLTYSFGSGLEDLWVLKLDDSGNVQWQKTYGGSGHDSAGAIQQTSDGGYIVAGSTDSFSTGYADAWILKLDAGGNVVWQKTYGGTHIEDYYWASSIQQTSDGGYIVAGSFVLKIDGNGNVQWQKSYGSVAQSIQQTSDGGYIVAGEGDYEIRVLKIDGSGNVQWEKTYGKTYGDSGTDNASSIQQTSDGGYIVAGYAYLAIGSALVDIDALILKLDGNGNVQWRKIYSGTKFDHAGSIQQTSDGGYVVAGDTASFSDYGDVDSWVFKLDSGGNIQWQKIYGWIWSSYEFASSIKQTSDGGYIVDGYIAGTEGSFLLLKLDENGNIPNCSIERTSNAVVTDASATVNDITPTVVNTNASMHTSTVAPLDTNATVSQVCYFGPENPILISPNGGEVIPSGSTYTIQWNAPPEAVKFNLQYSINKGSKWKLIAKNITGSSYDWTVPLQKNNKKNCLVKVKGFNASGTKVGEDISDSIFTIEVVKLTSPDGEETLTSGSTHTITWTTNGTIRPVSSVKLFYSINGGSKWIVIKTLSGNPGTYNWTVPSASSSNCKVKVVLKDAGGKTVGNDISDGLFTIQP